MIYGQPFFSLEPQRTNHNCDCQFNRSYLSAGNVKDHLPKVDMVMKLLGKRHICLADTKSGKQPAAPRSAVRQPSLCSPTQLPTAALCDALVPKPACSKTFSWHIHTAFILLNSDYFNWQLLYGTFCLFLKTYCYHGFYINVFMCKVNWRPMTRSWDSPMNNCNWRQDQKIGVSLYSWIDTVLISFTWLPSLLD